MLIGKDMRNRAWLKHLEKDGDEHRTREDLKGEMERQRSGLHEHSDTIVQYSKGSSKIEEVQQEMKQQNKMNGKLILQKFQKRSSSN